MDGPTAARVDIALARNRNLDLSARISQKWAATDKHRFGGASKSVSVRKRPDPLFSITYDGV
jgi:hypothetical protein